MENDVYIDLLFLINFSMDFLCIYITAKILHRRKKAWRFLASAAFGGVYSVVSLFWGLEGFYGFLADIASCLVICAIAFAGVGKITSYFLSSLLFVGVSMMTGGCMSALFNLLNRINLPIDSINEDGISIWVFALLAIIAACITLLSGKLVSSKTSFHDCELKVQFNGNEHTYFALIDSGNLVRDPISGRAVIFLDKKASNEIFDERIIDDFKSGIPPVNQSYRTMRLIPINTVSGNSVLVALLPDNLIIKTGEKRAKILSPDALIAFSDICNNENGHTAIVPSEIIKF